MQLHVPYPDPWADRNSDRARREKRRRRRGSDETGYDIGENRREQPPTYHKPTLH